jgi:hypothetical protein
MPKRTPSTGLETANQKETSHPESWAVEVVFTLFSHGFQDRDFRKCEVFSRASSAGERLLVTANRFQVELEVANGERIKKMWHEVYASSFVTPFFKFSKIEISDLKSL